MKILLLATIVVLVGLTACSSDVGTQLPATPTEVPTRTQSSMSTPTLRPTLPPTFPPPITRISTPTPVQPKSISPTETKLATLTPTQVKPTTIAPPSLEPITAANARRVTNLAIVRSESPEGPEEMAFTKDGSYLIVLSGDQYGSAPTSTVRVRDVNTTEVVNQLDLRTDSSNVEITADGLHVISYGDGNLHLQEPLSGKVESEQEVGNVTAYDIWFSRDGSRMALRHHTDDHILELWDVKQGVSVAKLTMDGYLHTAMFSQDGKWLMMRSFDDFYVYDTQTGQLIARLQAHSPNSDEDFSPSSNLHTFDISPDGALLAIGGETYNKPITSAGFQLWDVRAGKLLVNWKSGKASEGADEIAYSPDGQWIAFGARSSAPTVYLFDGKTGKLQRTLPGSAALAFNPDGRLFADTLSDGTIQLWNTEKGTLLASLRGHEPQVESILFSPDGTRLASRGFDATVRLWGIRPANLAVVRFGVNVTAKDFNAGNFSYIVPKDWLAQGSAPARYQIDLTSTSPVLRSCAYTHGHTLYLTQFNVTLTITDLEKARAIAQKTFYGKYKSISCPSTHTFSSATDKDRIGYPDVKEIETWLATTMTPLGFIP